jgi:hypothetical protein
MPKTPMDLIPIDVAQALQRSFRLSGTLEMVGGQLDYEGSIEVTVDAGGLGELAKRSMLHKGRTAKAGPVIVRFRGRADYRRHAPATPPAGEKP